MESDLSDERLVLRILKEYPLFGHELADLPSLYAKVECDNVPLQPEWSDAKWQALLEQWREALEIGRTLNLVATRRPSGIPICLVGLAERAGEIYGATAKIAPSRDQLSRYVYPCSPSS